MSVLSQLPVLSGRFTAVDEAWHRNFHRLVFQGSRYPLRTLLPLLSGKRVQPSPEFVRKIRIDLETLLEEDIHNVKCGYYPKKALHFPVLFYLLSLAKSGPLDGIKVIRRAKRNDWREIPSHVSKDRYPDYYLRTFHWQTDGWFSEKSASRYDVSVQFLFGGIADIMRRMALPPVARSISRSSKSRILELACGTGSFIPQIKAAFPKAAIYGLDLSPDYIKFARKTVKGDDIFFVNENAESLSFPDCTFDAVICNNLFHELPPDVRRRVFTEVFRVLKVNSVFSITDSVQLDDNPNMNESIRGFSKRFHEPFHKQYIGDDLKNIFEECSFKVGETHPHLFSKSIHGTKLEALDLGEKV